MTSTANTPLITCEIEAVIERDYKPMGQFGWDDSFYYGFTVNYTETVGQGFMGDIPVNEFTVSAGIDTGREIYYITYGEITVNTASGFEAYVRNTIQKSSLNPPPAKTASPEPNTSG